MFPFLHEPEPTSLWQGARAEGRVHEVSLRDKCLYVAKYLFAHQRGAPADIVSHFEQQKTLLRRLPRAEGAGPKMGFVGDLMWIRKGWSSYASPGLLSHLRSFDGLVGNLETVISKNHPVPEFLPDYFTYNSRPELVSSLKKVNGQNLFAALSFANNHVLDKGDDAALDTLEFLRELGISNSGLAKPGFPTWESFLCGGLPFAFHAATFGLNDQSFLQKTKLALNLIPNLSPPLPGIEPDLRGVRAALAAMPKGAVKIIYLHWGHEFESYPTARQMQVARRIVGFGADVIVGSGSHVAGPTEVLWVNGHQEEVEDFAALSQHTLVEDPASPPRKAMVFYSLGNFANAMFTFPCRVAQVKGLQFSENEEGITFAPLPSELFFNQFSSQGLNLIPLEEEFIQNGSSAQKKQLHDLLNFLGEPHLFPKFDQPMRKL